MRRTSSRPSFIIWSTIIGAVGLTLSSVFVIWIARRWQRDRMLSARGGGATVPSTTSAATDENCLTVSSVAGKQLSVFFSSFHATIKWLSHGAIVMPTIATTVAHRFTRGNNHLTLRVDFSLKCSWSFVFISLHYEHMFLSPVWNIRSARLLSTRMIKKHNATQRRNATPLNRTVQMFHSNWNILLGQFMLVIFIFNYQILMW